MHKSNFETLQRYLESQIIGQQDLVKQLLIVYLFKYDNDDAISSFKEGARIIALKNRLAILPIFIKTNANEILKEAINKRDKDLTIDIEIE